MNQSDSCPLPEEVALKMRTLQQGDVLTDVRQLCVDHPDGQSHIDLPDGAVILSQTCDIVRENLPYLHIAPRVSLSEDDARQARKGRRPRYVNLPEIGTDAFVDLSNVGSLHKRIAAKSSSVRGVTTDDQISKFGKSVGRHFSRFAYPDDVSRFFAPLSDVIQSKAGKLDSPEGRRIEDVLQLRVESISGWSHRPYELRLILIVCPGALPTFENDELPEFEEGLQSWLYDGAGMIRRSAHEVAERLERETDPAAKYYLWSALGDAWASRCSARATGIALEAEVVSADEFPLTRMLQTEILDLDHLSAADGQPI